ncbi:MAG: helix-turn-helix transcriptional regulator [Gudongella sp.]|nr:helix-turn-helix transcriptional regulator [Gudongella sp.]
MTVSYNKLFKLLIDRNIKRSEFRKTIKISPNTMTKISNNEYVSMEVLVKICHELKCDIGEIMEVIPKIV